jgi:hypothetical protein
MELRRFLIIVPDNMQLLATIHHGPALDNRLPARVLGIPSTREASALEYRSQAM